MLAVCVPYLYAPAALFAFGFEFQVERYDLGHLKGVLLARYFSPSEIVFPSLLTD